MEVIAGIQGSEQGGWNHWPGCGTCRRWVDSGYDLNTGLTGFADGINIYVWVKDNSEVSRLNNWKNVVDRQGILRGRQKGN